MSTPEQNANYLLELGKGVGSKVETIKINSQRLRGNIVEELNADTSHFSEDQIQLIKFHGMYQQEDRDARQARKAAGAEKAYQFMIRSRIPGGALTPEQYLTHHELAERYGNGTLRITTRQSFQLHGILKGNIRSVIRGINESLLSTLAACGDVNRNVMACPAAPTTVAHQQIQELAHELAMYLAPRTRAYAEIWLDGEKAVTLGESEEEESEMYGATYLPRKFKIGIAYPGDNCIDIYTQDLGFVARLDEQDNVIGFTVVVGGGMGMTHGKAETHPRLALPLGDITREQYLDVAREVIAVQRDYGNRQNRKRARLKYVIEDRGIAWYRAEVERRLGYALQDPSEIVFHDVKDHLGWEEQLNGKWSLGLNVNNGRISDTETVQIKSGLRETIEKFKPNVRLTGQQNILLIDIPAEQREALEANLQKYGIITDPNKVGAYRFAMACPAMPTCGLAVAESERALPDIVQLIADEMQSLGLGGEPLSVRMTGCPNGCARPHMGDIGFVGRSKGMYNLYIGGDWQNTRMSSLFVNTVRVENILTTLRPLFILWRDERQPQETFGDYCTRIGFTELKERVTAQETVGA